MCVCVCVCVCDSIENPGGWIQDLIREGDDDFNKNFASEKKSCCACGTDLEGINRKSRLRSRTPIFITADIREDARAACQFLCSLREH